MAAATLPRPAWRWMVLLSRTFFSCVGLGTFKAMGVFIPLFVEEFSTNTAAAGLVCILPIGLGFVSVPLVGAVIPVYGARVVSVVGGVVAASCIMAASASPSIALLGFCLALSSLGQTSIQAASVKAIMDYFPGDFAAANGVSLAGGPLGMMFIPPVTEYLVYLYGWRVALGLLGAFNLNFVVCGALFRPLKSSGYSVVPSGIEDNMTPIKPDKPDGLVGRMLDIMRERFDTKILTQYIFILYQAVSVLCGVIFGSWHLFVIPQGIQLGFGGSQAAFLATFGGIGSVLGRLGHGPFVDRGVVSASTMFVISCFVFAASTLTNPLAVQSYGAMAFLCSVSGFAMGGLYPLMFVLVHEVTGDRHVAAYSWLFVSLSTGELAGAVLAGIGHYRVALDIDTNALSRGGWMNDVTGRYELVFVVMGGISVSMAIMVASTQYIVSCCKPDDN